MIFVRGRNTRDKYTNQVHLTNRICIFIARIFLHLKFSTPKLYVVFNPVIKSINFI